MMTSTARDHKVAVHEILQQGAVIKVIESDEDAAIALTAVMLDADEKPGVP